MNVSDTSAGTSRPMDVWRGAAAGLLGGLIAAGAMSLAHKGLGMAGLDGAKPPQAEQGDDATVKVADGLMQRLFGRPLAENTKPLAGHVVHYAFGGGVGALYGGSAELAPRVTTGVGLPFGIAVWLGAHVITVPALGLAKPPTRRPLSIEAPEFLLHLVYGAVAELLRRFLRGRYNRRRR
jgi:putative membrane protein